jgi:hypothetical protein
VLWCIPVILALGREKQDMSSRPTWAIYQIQVQHGIMHSEILPQKTKQNKDKTSNSTIKLKGKRWKNTWYANI